MLFPQSTQSSVNSYTCPQESQFPSFISALTSTQASGTSPTRLVVVPWEHHVLWDLSHCFFHLLAWNSQPYQLITFKTLFLHLQWSLSIRRMWWWGWWWWWHHCLLGTYCARHCTKCFIASHLILPSTMWRRNCYLCFTYTGNWKQKR